MTHFMPHRKFVYVPVRKKECKQVYNENFFNKTVLLGLPQKGLKQVADLQHNALTSLIHFVQLYDKVN